MSEAVKLMMYRNERGMFGNTQHAPHVWQRRIVISPRSMHQTRASSLLTAYATPNVIAHMVAIEIPTPISAGTSIDEGSGSSPSAL